ncbi:CRM-domain containing factor cfm9, mitochondrial [Orobanche hederae]
MISAYARNLARKSIRTLSSLPLNQRNEVLARSIISAKLTPGITYVASPSSGIPSAKMWNSLSGVRCFSAKSMRSKVEKRMQRESGKTLREIRRAKKLRKKLMTDEERLIYNLRRAKKKIALLLQKLKKYELPELPPPRHDPELFTPEQLQAYKKIGFRNKNYVPVGVRGVFGGVVQNMHLHWKFHETVQVCCDNFAKEKIKEMATMLARLSGGIVVNIHNIKTIIMFRGRNYRQPKNLIPINTLTKRKALFKARFEQALESQRLNIKKTEQDLRRKGVNPDDPVAMASIQRVASTFFNAIDKKEGSPYIFREDKTTQVGREGSRQPQDDGDEESDQEELDRFIAEIEDAADKEWAEEEAAEKEELHRIRYWNREDFGGRFGRSEINRSEDSDDEDRGRRRTWSQNDRRTVVASENEDEDGDGDVSEVDDEWDSDNFRRDENESRGRKKKNPVSKDSRTLVDNYRSSTDDENYEQPQTHERGDARRGSNRTNNEDLYSESEIVKWESDATSGEDY